MRGAPASPAASAAIAEVESAAWARAAGAPLANLPCRPTAGSCHLVSHTQSFSDCVSPNMAEKRGDGSCDTVGGMICTVTCTCFLIHLIGSFTVGGMVCTVCFFDSFDHSRRSAAVCFSPCFTCAHGISRIHGTSIVLYRNHKIRKHQFVAVAEWTGGLYVSPTMARSRPSGLIAGAWAAMMSLGLNGYMENTGHIMEASKKIQRG